MASEPRQAAGFPSARSPGAMQPFEEPRAGASGKGKAGIAAAIAAILAAVYANEGGYVDNRHDPGGATNYGVTQQVARHAGYRGNMRDFPKHCGQVASQAVCADKIYVARYIEGPGYLPIVAIEPAVAEELIDTAVNMGAPRPSRWFQLSMNELVPARLTVDGKLGPASVDAYARLQARLGPRAACVATLAALDGKQLAEYQRLVRVNPSLHVFYRGWVTRRIGNVDRAKCGKGLS